MRLSKSFATIAISGLLASGLAAAVGTGSAGARPAAHTPRGIKLIHPTAQRAAIRPNIPVTPLTINSSVSVGAITPKPRVILAFWGTQWTNDYAGAAPALQRFFQGLSGPRDTWGTILDQYCEGVPAGTAYCNGQGIPIVHPKTGPLAGVFFDRSSPEPDTASNSQLAAEAVRVAKLLGLNSTTAQNTQIVVASPSGTHPDGFPNTGFCAYHDSVSSSIGTIAWTNLPYLPDLGAGPCTTLDPATLLDGYFSTETHEYAETATDFTVEPGPLGWIASDGEEIGDLCVNLDARLTLSTGTFDVQGLWSNSANNCVTSN